MKKIVLILCSMISGITVVFAENTAYLCRKCAVYTVTDHTPVSTNCNASGFHIWTKLDPVGEKVFAYSALPLSLHADVNVLPLP